MSDAAPYPAFDGTQPCATVDPEEFHPEVGSRPAAAQSICKGGILGYPQPCPFLHPCLDYALHHMVSGVWGGTSGQERRVMRNKRGIVATPLSFGTGPTNATTAKRMAGRGTPIVDIAAHLGITHEAVHRILRTAQVPSPEPRGSRGVAQRVACDDCGAKLLRSSLGRHKRASCPAREAAA